MNLLFSNISIKILPAYVVLLLLIITAFLHCSKEENHSPQTHKECLDVAEFGLPGESPYCLPFAVDSSYLLSQSYCSGGGKSHHSRFAYDFKMPFGTEILAARAGEVVELREHFSDENNEGGNENVVVLRHEDETLSLYIHMM